MAGGYDSGAAQHVYMESPHTSSTDEEAFPSNESNNFPPKPPYPLVDEVGVGEIFFIDENASKVPKKVDLQHTSDEIVKSNMSPDEIKKKAVADLVRNRKEWLKTAEVEVVKEEPKRVKRRKLNPQPPELGKHTKPEEYDMDALEQVEDEMSHLPSSLRKFLGEE